MSVWGGWTEAAEARLQELWHLGLSTGHIGRDLGCGKNAVVSKARRMKLAGRPSPIRAGQGKGVSHRAKPRAPQLAELMPGAVAPVAVLPVERFPLPERGAARGCCWPIGEPRSPGFRLCDAPSAAGRPYCPAHCARAYVAPAFRSAEEAAAEAVMALQGGARGAGAAAAAAARVRGVE